MHMHNFYWMNLCWCGCRQPSSLVARRSTRPTAAPFVPAVGRAPRQARARCGRAAAAVAPAARGARAADVWRAGGSALRAPMLATWQPTIPPLLTKSPCAMPVGRPHQTCRLASHANSKIRRDTRAHDYSLVLNGAAGEAESGSAAGLLPTCRAATTQNTRFRIKRPIMPRALLYNTMYLRLNVSHRVQSSTFRRAL